MGKKLHRIRHNAGEETVKGKGMPNAQLKAQFSCEDYLDALYNGATKQARFKRMMRKDLILEHTNVTKYAISTINDAVFLLTPHSSRPFGHYRNREETVSSALWGSPLIEVPASLQQERELPMNDQMVLAGDDAADDEIMVDSDGEQALPGDVGDDSDGERTLPGDIGDPMEIDSADEL